jgi:hypothetical protein
MANINEKYQRLTSMNEMLKEKRKEILKIARKHGVKNVRVFGSVARAQANPDSDIDLLVDLDEGQSLFDLGGFLMEVQEILGVKVDVVTEKGLHWYIRDRVLEEAQEI